MHDSLLDRSEVNGNSASGGWGCGLGGASKVRMGEWRHIKMGEACSRVD